MVNGESIPGIDTFDIFDLSWEAFGGAKKRLKDKIKDFDPQILVNYLESSGWIHQTLPKTPGGMLFVFGEQQELAVFIPVDKDYVDYELHMMEALRTLVDIVPILGHEKLDHDDLTR